MMHYNPFSFSSIFFTFIILFSLHTLLNAASLVPDTCNEIVRSDANVEYPFCVKAIGSDPGSATATTLAQLGDISFQLAISKAISISSNIATIFKDPKFDPSSKDALKACSEVYSDAHNVLQEGFKAFKNGDYSTAKSKANAALVVPTTCESGFKVSPLTKENSDFFQLAAISLGFTDLLHKVVY